jgi:probable rRNA maturation factor
MAPGDQRRRPAGRADPPRRLLVSVVDSRGRDAGGAGLARWLAGAAPRTASGSVTVAIVADARIRALNRRYRGKDYATDVLSFPADDRSPQRPPFLGDIVIARGVARGQARAARHSERTELRVLALHGLLHLLGYDHERDDGEMARVERRIRRRAGLTVGLIERTDKRR